LTKGWTASGATLRHERAIGSSAVSKAAVAGPAAARGTPPQGDYQDGAGDAAECHPLEPLGHGRSGGHFAFECRVWGGKADQKTIQGIAFPPNGRKQG